MTVHSVMVAKLGPVRLWPGTTDVHPLDSRAEVIVAADPEGYTVQPGEYWSIEYRGELGGRPDHGYGRYGRFAVEITADAAKVVATPTVT